ncbi:D-alanyl-D-alanine carboxypeptidase family protein [Anaerosalibacter sp. Marseille-P3206]|uniref:D-alanyl-D-alanine carboxypeptidase family protein n=1 Tax=Anaerosalibacter sp. Marseille-P3206 TaxID=1871005 RepID=UPI000BE9923A|nr:D-alanyl-D-alanine carboxypeptidase family protein [Anaerosalibacter sp. Marseille-P3206]
MRIKTVLILITIVLFISSISYCTEPDISAQSAILMDTISGRVLFDYNSQEKLPMASTTKIMTALIGIENGNMDDIVKINKDSVGIEGSSIYLYEDEEISKKDLLYGLMLRSGNDSAVAIAKHIGGDVGSFIEMMNMRSKEIGALNTNFVNPHGLEDKNHYTTAYDLALITKEALKSKEFREIVSAKTWVANRDKNNYFYNKNKTLWQYDGGDGVKIGYTKSAGRCLVSSATRKGMQLIAVVLNDGNWFNDCYKLFDYGFDNYESIIVYDKGQFIKNLKIKDGNEEYLPVITEDICTLPLKEDEKEKIKVVIHLPDELEAPIIKNTKVGRIEVYLDGEMMYTTNLISKYEVKKINFFEKLLRSLDK